MTTHGLYCPVGDFHIDPHRGVPRAIVTHAHGDHLYKGSKHYLVSTASEGVSRVRLSPNANVDSIEYGETVERNGVRISLHPAGHILGSAQVRLEYRGEVWVVSGDYKTCGGDPTCTPFEPLRCHGFVTESTFALPIYHWASAASVFESINRWWRGNADDGCVCVLFAYSLGKAQRLLAGLDPGIGPIVVHETMAPLVQAYRDASVWLPPTVRESESRRAMVLAPSSVQATPWLDAFEPHSTAYASGWLAVRKARRAVDRNFVLSDHADWRGLLWAIDATRAQTVYVTHGSTQILVKYLRGRGLDASMLTRTPGELAGSHSQQLLAAG